MPSSATREGSERSAPRESAERSEQAQSARAAAAPLPGGVPVWLKNKRRADEIRSYRSQVKRELKAAPTMAESWEMAAGIIGEPDSRLESMRVFQLLGACRKTGPTRVRQILLASGAGESTRIGELTERQRLCVMAYLLSGTSQGMEKSSGLLARDGAYIGQVSE